MPTTNEGWHLVSGEDEKNKIQAHLAEFSMQEVLVPCPISQSLSRQPLSLAPHPSHL